MASDKNHIDLQELRERAYFGTSQLDTSTGVEAFARAAHAALPELVRELEELRENQIEYRQMAVDWEKAYIECGYLRAEIEALRAEGERLKTEERRWAEAYGRDTAELRNAKHEVEYRLEELHAAAADYVERREEATDNIWYTDGRKGRKLLKLLGIKYEKRG